jgi:hypothetical protein
MMFGLTEDIGNAIRELGESELESVVNSDEKLTRFTKIGLVYKRQDGSVALTDLGKVMRDALKTRDPRPRK